MSEGGELFAAPKPSSGAAPESSGSEAGEYRVLARRARPQAFADVVGQEHVTQTLVNAIRTGRLAHAFVFSGMRGVGKTTTARILAKALNCEKGPTSEPCNECRNCVEITESRSLDVFEVDAASQTGIDAARELLETVKYQPASGRYRIYIIDEAHGLSKQAVDAFLKTLEEPPAHVKFILATTAAHKLPRTILSRCQRYDFRAVAPATVARALGEMVAREGVEADEEALLGLARESGGSMRDATSLLDQVLAYSGGRLDAAAVAEALGLADQRAVRELVAAVARRDPAEALAVAARVHAQGADAARFCEAVLERLRNLSVLAAAGRGALTDLLPGEVEELEAAGRGVDPADLQRWFRITLDALADLGRTATPRLVLEMAFVRMATLVPVLPIEDLLARLDALETGRSEPRGTTPRPSLRPSAPPAVSAPAVSSGAGRQRSERADTGAPEAPAPRAPRTAPSEARPAGAQTTGGSDGTLLSRETAEPSPHQPRWQRLVDSLQKERASRFFRLSYSRVVTLDDDRIVVAVTGREAATALLGSETRTQIEAAIEREFGKALRFEPVAPGASASEETGPVDRATLDRRAREDPVVQLSVELLDGRVEAIVPRTRR
jgi:DNA polymerase III subunit gamma/tau